MAAQIIVWGVQGYLALGALVALAFVTFGVGRVDEGARGSSVAFRALLLPGCAVLWPVVLRAWIARAGRRATS